MVGAHDERLEPRSADRGSVVRSTGAPAWPAFVVPIVPAATLLTDKFVASQGAVGEPAILEFSYKLVAAPHTLLAMSLVTVAYVEISRLVAAGNGERTRSAVVAGLTGLLVVAHLGVGDDPVAVARLVGPVDLLDLLEGGQGFGVLAQASETNAEAIHCFDIRR